uniref:Transposable element P transposase-like RNase H C-terminal domain-containing protein n=1 Tax=Clytia hemisphaerica TaxID=252671 RepID=A0A7M5XJF7_9CNID
QIADRLMKRQKDPFKHILTYKMSQDHLELLLSCIRGKNGFCKNPEVRMFKSSVQRILQRNSIVGSKFSNCTNFQDEGYGSFFSLKWSKRNSPVNDSTPENEEDLFADVDKDLVAAVEFS